MSLAMVSFSTDPEAYGNTDLSARRRQDSLMISMLLKTLDEIGEETCVDSCSSLSRATRCHVPHDGYQVRYCKKHNVLVSLRSSDRSGKNR